MPRAQGRARAVYYLPHCRGPTARPQGIHAADPAGLQARQSIRRYARQGGTRERGHPPLKINVGERGHPPLKIKNNTRERGHPPLKIKNKTENGELFGDMKSAKKRAKIFTKLRQIVRVFD